MESKRGRPALPKSKLKSHRVIVRVSPADLPYLRAKAKENERTLGAYLRELGLRS